MIKKLGIGMLGVIMMLAMSACMAVPTEQPDVSLDSYNSAVLSETIMGTSEPKIEVGDKLLYVRVIYSENIEDLYHNTESSESGKKAGFQVQSKVAYAFDDGAMKTEKDTSQAHTVTDEELDDPDIVAAGLKVATSVTGLKEDTEYYARMEAYGEAGTDAQYVYSPIVNFRTADYQIAFDANGGKGTMDPCYCPKGRGQKLPENQFERTGYVFREWNTKADGSGVSYADGEEVKELTTVSKDTVTLYAQWDDGIEFQSNNSKGGSVSVDKIRIRDLDGRT